MIAGVVLAAGRSERFGGVKVLAPFAGRALLRWPIAALSQAGIDEVLVVADIHTDAIEGELSGIDGCRVIRCPGAHESQALSLRGGLQAAEAVGADAVVVVLADQPLIEARAITRVLSSRDPGAPAVRATYDGVPAHPVLIERRLWPELTSISGDRGAGSTLSVTPGVRLVACDGLGSAADVDTPEDLARLEASLG